MFLTQCTLQLQAVSHAVWWWVTHAWSFAMGGVEAVQLQPQCLYRMTACFLFFGLFLMSYLKCFISAAAVRGVHQRQRSFLQVADGERTGLDHLLNCWGELQGGCKQVLLSLLMSYDAFFSLFVDWEMCLPYARLTWLNWWRAGQQKTPTS